MLLRKQMHHYECQIVWLDARFGAFDEITIEFLKILHAIVFMLGDVLNLCAFVGRISTK